MPNDSQVLKAYNINNYGFIILIYISNKIHEDMKLKNLTQTYIIYTHLASIKKHEIIHIIEGAYTLWIFIGLSVTVS